MKIQRISTLLALPLFMLLAPVSASASPLDPAHVPAEAKWVIHLDLSALTETELAQRVREKRPQMVQGLRQWMQQRYGIDPREDLDSLTLFSESYQSHTGTMILKADYDRQKVQSELEAKEGVETESWMDHTLYTVDKRKMEGANGKSRSYDRPATAGGQADDRDTAPSEPADADVQAERGDDEPGRTITLVLVDDQTVIFGSSPENAKEAVSLVKGNYPSLKGKRGELLDALPEGAIFYGAAVKLDSISQHEGIFPILSQHQRIVWAIGQQDDEIYEKLTLVANSPEVAEQMKTIIEGFVAFCNVWAADNETLSGLVQATEVRIEDQTVHAEWRGETGDVVAALAEVRQRLQKRFGRPHDEDRSQQ